MNSPRDELRCELEEVLRFEALLIDLSARFVNVPADQVDSEIEDAQRRVCECLGLDTALLWQWTGPPPAQPRLTHMHRPLSGPPMPAPAEIQAVVPWAYAQLLAGRTFVHSTLDELPAEAGLDKATFERHGVKSNVGLPLAVGGAAPFGALTVNTTREHRSWTEAIVRRLQLVAQIFANALARKYADAEARLLLSQLAHLNRVATVGEFATALAHELNQPLGAILRNAEAAEVLLHGANPDLEELRAIVADIKRDDQRAGGVIDRLRSMLQRRNIELRPAELPALVGEVVAIAFADASRRGIRIVCEVPSELPAVHCDRVQVQQVLLNLIMNGMDAIDEAGAADPCITLRAQAGGDGRVELSVSDTGRGIAPQALHGVFEPFYTTKAGGMGMGLAISRTLVEAQGGRLWVGSPGGQRDRGASFHFSLPAVAAAEGRP